MPGTHENLAVEQHSHWYPGRAGAPGYLEQCRQLTAARAEHPWLAGHAVAARGGDGVARPVKREPHLLLQSA